jgi:prepilin-type processing-associated H-X9-DG protein
MGSSVYTAHLTPNSTENDKIPMCDATIPGTDILHCTQDRADGNVWAAARSRHPGGVCVLYADGSVHFDVDSIDPLAWTALSTRSAGDIAP